MLLLQTQPIPRDIPLPLPVPEPILIALIVISFLAHILFVNLMLGGSILTTIFQIIGLKDKKYDKLAYEIANTITVNKSIAVVLGVAPLLIINTLYTVYFYSANALTGNLWISIIPILVLAFLTTYYHKYTWEKYESKKAIHIGIGIASLAMFLFVPLIFLTNINLMLFPEKWAEVEGFFSAMILWNVIPRYFHFLAGTMAITGLFVAWYFSREKYHFEENLNEFNRNDVRKIGLKLTFYVTISQVIFGPLVLFTLPWQHVNMHLIGVVTTAVIIAAGSLHFLHKMIKEDKPILGRNYVVVILLLSITVVLMGWGRHVYRKSALQDHQQLMKEKTEAYYGIN